MLAKSLLTLSLFRGMPVAGHGKFSVECLS